jgi:hypothetical protein
MVINTNNLLKEFNENGYVIVRNCISPENLDACKVSIVKALKKVYEGDGGYEEIISDLNRYDKDSLYRFHRNTNELSCWTLIAAELHPVLESLGGQEAIPKLFLSGYLLGLARDKRLTYNFHQESSYMRIKDEMITAHFPLFYPSTRENGTMSVLKGSHIQGQLDFEKKRKSLNSYTDLIPVDISSLVEKYEEVYFDLQPGDCAFFSKYLIHRSNYNSSKYSRPVGVFRYFMNNEDNFEELTPGAL